MSELEPSEPAAVWVAVTDLKPWDRNPRKNEKAIGPVANSIKRFGFASPIIARKADGEIIAGHTRLLAAESLGLTHVPVRYLDLDPADAHLLALADNKLNEIAEWDESLMLETLSEFSLGDAELAGFDEKELEKIGDGLLDMSGELDQAPTGMPFIGFGEWKLSISEDEAEALSVRIKEFTEETGSILGLGSVIVRAVTSGKSS